MTDAPLATSSFLATRRGKLVLTFLCAVAFLDFLDTSIVNVALPSIARDLHFSVQNLQWVLSGYIVTYGGFLLLGGRLADLLGRRRMLMTGTALFGLASLAGGLAQNSGMLVGARLAQGLGAALMSPAALSMLTTTFSYGADRVKALGAWGAMAGISSVAGVALGGVITASLSWRWVLFVNLPVCVAVLAGASRLAVESEPLPFGRKGFGLSHFDLPGAFLGTGGMLLLVYGLVRAPEIGWGASGTIGVLAGAAALLAVFALVEARSKNPLVPVAIFRIKGLPAADATQVIGMAGFYSAFFFITLYMQNVLGFSPTRAGLGYVPVAAMVVVAGGRGHRPDPQDRDQAADRRGRGDRGGRRVLAVAHPGGRPLLDEPVPRPRDHGIRARRRLRRRADRVAGRGAATARRARRSLINASFQVGAALGLAIFTAVATSWTNTLAAAHVARAAALTDGFHRALLLSSIFVLAAAVIALRAANTRGEPTSEITGIAVTDSAEPAVAVRPETEAAS